MRCRTSNEVLAIMKQLKLLLLYLQPQEMLVSSYLANLQSKKLTITSFIKNLQSPWLLSCQGSAIRGDKEEHKGNLRQLLRVEAMEDSNQLFPPFFCADTFDTNLLLIVCALR